MKTAAVLEPGRVGPGWPGQAANRLEANLFGGLTLTEGDRRFSAVAHVQGVHELETDAHGTKLSFNRRIDLVRVGSWVLEFTSQDPTPPPPLASLQCFKAKCSC